MLGATLALVAPVVVTVFVTAMLPTVMVVFAMVVFAMVVTASNSARAQERAQSRRYYDFHHHVSTPLYFIICEFNFSLA
jgi:hypothetical protein